MRGQNKNQIENPSPPRSTPGSAAICSSAEKAYSSAKQDGKSEDVAGAVAAKVLYTKVFEVFDGSIECGSSVDAINGMADYFNEFGKSVVTTVRQKLLLANFSILIFQISPFSLFRPLHFYISDLQESNCCLP